MLENRNRSEKESKQDGVSHIHTTFLVFAYHKGTSQELNFMIKSNFIANKILASGFAYFMIPGNFNNQAPTLRTWFCLDSAHTTNMELFNGLSKHIHELKPLLNPQLNVPFRKLLYEHYAEE